MADPIIFDSTIIKRQVDGDVVMSSFLDDGEEIVEYSFAQKPVTAPVAQ